MLSNLNGHGNNRPRASAIQTAQAVGGARRLAVGVAFRCSLGRVPAGDILDPDGDEVSLIARGVRDHLLSDAERVYRGGSPFSAKELVVNLKTAKTLRLDLPGSVLAPRGRSDRKGLLCCDAGVRKWPLANMPNAPWNVLSRGQIGSD
jgi:hypothetical protein